MQIGVDVYGKYSCGSDRSHVAANLLVLRSDTATNSWSLDRLMTVIHLLFERDPTLIVRDRHIRAFTAQLESDSHYLLTLTSSIRSKPPNREASPKYELATLLCQGPIGHYGD